jgi:mannose-6-phosphate isomerase-like protein (cupin superfamily)
MLPLHINLTKTKKMKTYNVTELGNMESITRVMLGEKLGLTGAEISANRLPAGAEIPFAHSHKRNEEIYIFTSGKGWMWLDGTKLPVKEGTAIRVSPSVVRSIKADNTGLFYFCIQADEGSLVQANRNDGIISETKPQW